jgi:hypothetical protein
MISAQRYAALRGTLVALGYGDEIDWQQTVRPPTCPEEFALEAVFVICNSGMKAQIARAIFDRVVAKLRDGKPVGLALNHDLKRRAIDKIWREREYWFDGWKAALERGPEPALEFLGTLDHIGPITKYHLAKNFGLDVVKPDRHLQRLASEEGVTPDVLCRRLARDFGDRAATVDYVLWRSCNLGLL